MRTDKEIRKAVIEMSLSTGLSILKLTEQEYHNHGLSDVLLQFGNAENANLHVFYQLQHTITGWPGGKPNADDTYRPERAQPFPKRVIVFSPHPDDDVISMGGTIRKLSTQGHDVHVIYQTSGNIAVSGDDVMHYMHFMNAFNEVFSGNMDKVITEKYREIRNFIRTRQSEEDNTKDLLTVKGLIRRGEARMACAYNNIPKENIHFLDMPFYESGKVEKLPISEKDIDIIEEQIKAVEPQMIFLAGDLADPHGTHRKCTEAVFSALERCKANGDEWLKDCNVWLYRGAWAEWDVADIDMAVPMSPKNVIDKRNSILRHHSQMEGAPYKGDDQRLFWQRAEDRNRNTAQIYDRLGFTSYEAMEAFVKWEL